MTGIKGTLSKYPLYEKMWEYRMIGSNASNAFSTLKDSVLPSVCEDYANKHPNSPLYDELMGISAFLDAGPGSIAYREHYQAKFSSPELLVQQSLSKLQEWMVAHPDDMEVLCIRAGIETVAKWKANRTVSVGHLARVMTIVTNADNFLYTYLWCITANAVELWDHLGFLEKEEQQKAYADAQRITLRDVLVTWLFVPYPVLVAYLAIFGYSSIDWFPVFGFIGVPILLIVLSCTLFARLLHKPLKVTLSTTGCLAFLWGFTQYEMGGRGTSFEETMRRLVNGTADMYSFGWYLVACLVVWILGVAAYRTVKWLGSLGEVANG